MDMQMVGTLIKQRRKELGYTQQSFADKISVAVRTVTGWETGQHAPLTQHVTRIIEVLKFDAETAQKIIKFVTPEDPVGAAATQLASEVLQAGQTPDEREQRRAEALKLVDELLNDPRKLDRWLGYGNRLREES